MTDTPNDPNMPVEAADPSPAMSSRSADDHAAEWPDDAGKDPSEMRATLEHAVVARILPHVSETTRWLSDAELRALAHVPGDRDALLLSLAIARARAEVPDTVHVVGEVDPAGPGITPLAALGDGAAADAWATAWMNAEIAAGRLGAAPLCPPTETHVVPYNPPLPPAPDPLAGAIRELEVIAERLFAESGDPAARAAGFDPRAWLREWVAEPNSALGQGRRPLDFLGSEEGRELIRSLLISMQTGAYW
jgi:hypothetical protein